MTGVALPGDGGLPDRDGLPGPAAAPEPVRARTSQTAMGGLLRLYPFVTRLLEPAVPTLLRKRVKAGKEDPARLGERRGEPGLPRPGTGPLVWVHSASVGEALSVLPLIGRLLEDNPDLHVLATTATVTSAAILKERLPDRAMHQFVPLDHPRYVDRFLEAWRPDLALWVESEFWPNLLHRTARRGVPVVLVNARVSERSFKSWNRFPSSSRGLLNQFSACLAQDDIVAGRLEALGAKQVQVTGNLKFASPPLPADGDDLEHLGAALAGRPVLLAASTHDEEQTIARAHTLLAKNHPDLITIIAPRQPSRGAEIARELRLLDLHVAQRSESEKVERETGIYLADTIGEMGLFFRLADVAFLGRSLVEMGGSNPLEAARLECAILHGPYIGNFSAVYQDLSAAGAARSVTGAEDLAETAGQMFADKDRHRAMIGAAQGVVAQADAVIERVMDALRPHLSRALGNERGL